MSAASSCPSPLLHTSKHTMENSEENNLSKLTLLEAPNTGDSCADDEDVKSAIKPRFSPLPRRRSSVSSDEGELEPPTSVARKVSFADAFGFDLVSVKEFDTWEVPTISQNHTFEVESTPIEEFFLTPSFVLPSSDGIMKKLVSKKVLLELVDFLPKTTCMKGIIRVLNMSYEKQVYVRMSLDNWQSYYDLLAEYVPDSCNGDTDQFFFNISLVAPYQNDGAKVEFCICFETPVGTFWDNNDGQNYILICHKKEQIVETNKLAEDFADKYKKSCLKPSLSKEEDEEVDMLETKKSGVTELYIPRIICSHCDPKQHNKDEEEDKRREQNIDAENNLELFLSQHFVKTRITSSEDEYNHEVLGQPRFQTEEQSMECLEDYKTGSLTLDEHSKSDNFIQQSEEIIKTDLTAQSLGAEQFGSISAAGLKLEVSTILQKEAENNEIITLSDSTLTEECTELVDQPPEDIGPPPGNEIIEKLILNKKNNLSVSDMDNTTAETASFVQTESLQLTGHLDDNANPHSYFYPNNKECINSEQAEIPEYREIENHHNLAYMSSDIVMVSKDIGSKEEKCATDDAHGKISQNWESEHGFVTNTIFQKSIIDPEEIAVLNFPSDTFLIREVQKGTDEASTENKLLINTSAFVSEETYTACQGTEQDKKLNVDNHEDIDLTLLHTNIVPIAKQYCFPLDDNSSTSTYYNHPADKTLLNHSDFQNPQELHSFTYPLLQDNDRGITTDQKKTTDMHGLSKMDKITEIDYVPEDIFQIAGTLDYTHAENIEDTMPHESSEILESPPQQGMFIEKIIIAVMTEEKFHSEINTQGDESDHRQRCYMGKGESNKLTEDSQIGSGPHFQLLSDDLEGNLIIDPGVHTDLVRAEIVDNDLSIDERTEDIAGSVMASPSILNCFCEENIICAGAKEDQPQSYCDKICSNVTTADEGVSNVDCSIRSSAHFSEEFKDDIGTKGEHLDIKLHNENRVYESVMECVAFPEQPLVHIRTASKVQNVNIEPNQEETLTGSSISNSIPDTEIQPQTLEIKEQGKLGNRKQYQEPLPEKSGESDNISSSTLSIDNVSSKVFCFIMFVVFAGLMYHYDFLVCFALYLFSLYWLYWEGDRNKKPLKKE